MRQLLENVYRTFGGWCFLLVAVIWPCDGWAQRQAFSASGQISFLRPGQISIVDENGKAATYKIQDKGERAIVLDGARVNAKARIAVTGTLPVALLQPGMTVRFVNRIDRLSRFEAPQASFDVDVREERPHQISADLEPKGKDFVDCTVTGRVEKVDRSKLHLSLAKSALAPKGRLTIKFDSAATFSIVADSLSWVQPGDRVTRASGLQFGSGDRVIRRIEIELNPERKQTAISLHDQLMQKHSKLSDEPGKPREVRSRHFILRTDVSDRNAQVLLDKLEIMYGLIAGYFRRRPRQPIQCFVVRDLRQWPEDSLEPAGRRKIAEGAGVTLSARLGNSVRSIVFSCDKHSIVQHEAVHAFCYLTFGDTGPVWYAEGLAEMGNYWKPDELAVNIDPVVIGYLTTAEPKKLTEIVKAGQVTGDSWQAYSWRWALCHMLAANPNYADRFKALGINMMSGKGGSFESAYGNIAQEISFEYDQFVKNFGNGYRVDLCAWDWKTRAKKLIGRRKVRAKIDAQAGWQASGIQVESSKEYEFNTSGTWSINGTSEATDANGNASGNGRLIGVVMRNFELSQPFELGHSGTFKPPHDGTLYLRCRDAWTELADNEGTVTVELRLPKK